MIEVLQLFANLICFLRFLNDPDVAARLEGIELFCKMGIKGLSKLISTYAPRAMKEVDPKKYTGRLIAIDASVMIYQYLVSTDIDFLIRRLQFAQIRR